MSTKLDRARLAGTLFLIGVLVFLFGLHIAESVFPGYSVSENWVSDLGAMCTTAADYSVSGCVYVQPASDIFRTSMAVLGNLLLLGTYLILPLARSRRLFVFLGLLGVGILGAGIVTEASPPYHSLLAVLAFVSGGLAVLDSSRFVPRPLAWVWIGLGILIFVALVALAPAVASPEAPSWTPLGKGGVERMVVYPVAFWMLSFAVTLILSPEIFTKPSEPGAADASAAEHLRGDASGPGPSARTDPGFPKA